MQEGESNPRLGEQMRPTRVFVSYSRKDRAFADRLVAELTVAGYEGYLDTKDIAPGEPWQQRLEQLIIAADSVVFVISPDSVGSGICKWEVEETLRQGKRLLPLVYRSTEVASLPEQLSRLHFITCSVTGEPERITEESLEKALDLLAEAIDVNIGWVREHTRLGELARRWDGLGRPKHDVLRGASLIEAEYWLTQRPIKASEPTELHLGFIHRSREVEDETAREQKARIDALYVMQSRFLADLANQHVESGDALTGMLLAMEALPSTDGVLDRPHVQEARQAFYSALWARRELQLFAGHGGPIQNAVFSPDGKVIVTVGSDRAARLWEAADGRLLHVLEGHADQIKDVAFSPDGSVMVTVAADAKARVWNTTSGNCEFTLDLHDKYVQRVAFCPIDKRFFVAFESKSEQLFDASTGRELGVLGDEMSARASRGIAAFSPDGKWIATPQEDLQAGFRIYNANTGRQSANPMFRMKDSPVDDDAMLNHSAKVTCFTWSPDGKYLVSGSEDHTCRVWEMDSVHGEPVALKQVTVLDGHRGIVRSMVFSPDGRKLATSCDDLTVRIWDFWRGGFGLDLIRAVTGEQTLLKGFSDGGAPYVVFSRDSRNLVTVAGTFYGDDCSVQIWNAENGEPGARFQGHLDNVYRAQFAPGGETLLTASGDGTARLISPNCSPDFRRLEVREKNSYGTLEPRLLSLMCGAFDASGDRVATGSYQGVLHVWDASSGEVVSTIAGHKGPVRRVKFDRSGRLLSWGADMVLRIWDVVTGDALAALGEPVSFSPNHVNDFSLSRDEIRALIVPKREAACIWNLSEARPATVFEGNPSLIWSARFSPDEHFVATAHENGKACLWDSSSGTLVRTLEPEGKDVLSVDWSPDGRRLLTCSAAGAACIWDTSTWSLLGVFEDDTNRGSERAVFSPDGARIVTYGAHGGTDIWDIATGEKLITLQAEKGQITQLAFSADRRMLLTGDGHTFGNTARIWDASTGNLLVELVGHSRWILDVAFHPQGTHALTVSDDSTARIWRIFPDTQSVLDYAKNITRRGLTLAQRRKAYLDEAPPAWVIEQGKWPYATAEWSQWLVAKGRGEMPPLPNEKDRRLDR